MKPRNEHPCSHPPTRRLVLVIAALGALALSACGRPYTPRAPSSSLRIKSTPYFADDGTVGNYTCSATQVVAPEFDWDLDGTNFYQACVRKTDSASIALKGHASKSDTLCAFPAQYIDKDHVLAKIDTVTQAPVIQCASITNGLAAFVFKGVTFNAVFVTEGPDATAMGNCLAASNYYLCPRYSFGKFR